MKSLSFAIALGLFVLGVSLIQRSSAQQAGQGQQAQQTQQTQQGGDQILDGIGETSLAARYILDGNAEDRSRNSLHAQFRGTGTAFVENAQFGRALSLSGEERDFLELPGRALSTADAITATAWVFLRVNSPSQVLLSFGKGPAANFTCTLGEGESDGFSARITANGQTQGPTAPRIATERWVHLAVAFDPAAKTISLYADGERVARAENVTLNFESVFDRNNADANHLYVGRPQGDSGGRLNALVSDLRLYSIPLADEQIATIRRNAATRGGMAGDRRGRRGGRGRGRAPVVVAAPTAPIPYAALASVPDVAVETVVGSLPRLPETIRGEYRGNSQGPPVKVLWPAPQDNAEVQKAGTYTVTGRIAGSELQPKATVTVKAATNADQGPRRMLETFPLNQVVLDRMENGKETQFMLNRDKFFRGLAASNPDNFLFLFRETFGEKQPDGARALGGWDNQTTRLRGHGTGHYLSAIAQAYASTSYDPELHAAFQKKIDYLINTMYALSQKSGKPAEAGGLANADPTKVPPGAGREAYHMPPARRGGGGGGGGGGGRGPGNAGYDIREGYDSHLADVRTDYSNWGIGFISAYPPDQFIMLEKGATYGTGDNQIWAPYYTLHKIMAGLLDCYEVGGNEKALEIARGMGLWVHARLSALPTETRIRMWSTYIAGEYGGMNEVLARLSRLTKDQRFLECAKLFDNINFFYGNAEHAHGLAKNVDTLRDKHANQHIPQITGALETYRNTADPVYYHIADNFWHMATSHYMYSIGGLAGARRNSECFTAEPNSLFAGGFNPDGQNETCATYNMLKLSRQLFMYEQDAKYMDYYEQALYNHILSSVAENDPGNTYHVPLNPGARKGFGNGNMSGFTCCNGTALESSTKLQDSIYFRSADNRALYINLYVPSTLTWTERNVKVTQRTNFPYADSSKLTVSGGGNFDVMLRVPIWATKGFAVSINGQQQPVEAKPGSYLKLTRDWKDNDTIEVTMPFDFHLSRVMDQPNLASILYGPVLLAATESEPRTTWRAVTVNAGDLGKSISGDAKALRFKIGDAELKPFYETYDRHSVYFDVTQE